jgi:hypothetical protein
MKYRSVHPNEPQNSWEVSFILALYRPNIDLGITLPKLFMKIGKERSIRLREWAHEQLTGFWIKEHTLPQRKQRI